MARYLKPRFKLYYREKINLFLRNRFMVKEKFKNKIKKIKNQEYIPTYYYHQFKEKQRLKIIYGVLDKQFNIYYHKSSFSGGDLIFNLLVLLERRLDNMVYRMGVGSTRAESRQIVNHGCVLVNGFCCNISSRLIKIGDLIEIKKKCRNQSRIINSLNQYKKLVLPSWIFIDFKNFICYLKRFPFVDEINLNINENLILDSYK